MEKKPVWFAVCIVAIWAAVALIGIFGPSLEAGGDTVIPLSVIIAPIFGAVATGYVAIWAVSA